MNKYENAILEEMFNKGYRTMFVDEQNAITFIDLTRPMETISYLPGTIISYIFENRNPGSYSVQELIEAYLKSEQYILDKKTEQKN